LGGDGKTREWRSAAVPAYQRRTRAADALIAGAYLAGTNTRRVRRALAAAFSGSVGKDVVSRTKVKGDWDAWNARSLVDEPVVRLILDGTVARVRLDKKATSVSSLVALGVRADGQKVLCSRSKTMGGKSEAAWRTLLDDLVRRGLPPSWSSSMVRQASKRRWWRCGPTRLSNVAPVPTQVAMRPQLRKRGRFGNRLFQYACGCDLCEVTCRRALSLTRSSSIDTPYTAGQRS
jgi:hypothetical protein